MRPQSMPWLAVSTLRRFSRRTTFSFRKFNSQVHVHTFRIRRIVECDELDCYES